MKLPGCVHGHLAWQPSSVWFSSVSVAEQRAQVCSEKDLAFPLGLAQ